VHHLLFNDEDYDRLGMLIKWNPAVKTKKDQLGILQALLADKIDVVATDHAPHTLAEKDNSYFKAPSGGPLIQHSLVAMLEFFHSGKISLEKIVQKMAHNPATLFQISKRGFIREGFYADLVLVDLNDPWQVGPENILAKCGWSPFQGRVFKARVTDTFVSGHLAFSQGKFNEAMKGQRLTFERN
jgi:dihydroorotase